MEMNRLVVPARLAKAAKQLKDNMVILKGCSDEVKEVIALAKQQKLLHVHSMDKDGCKEAIFVDLNLRCCYCLPDDCEIVVQGEKPQVPQWIKDKFVVCEIRMNGNGDYIVCFPDMPHVFNYGLPATLRCEGWVFRGWLHEEFDGIVHSPFAFITKDGFIQDVCRDGYPFRPSTAYASVWQKVEIK